MRDGASRRFVGVDDDGVQTRVLGRRLEALRQRR